MRTFITLEFNNETKKEIYKVQKIIRENSFSGRFKFFDNFHLTVKFLGETDAEIIDLIYNDLNKRLYGFKSFSLKFCGIGAFDIGKTIGTIYLKVCNPYDNIEYLSKLTDEITVLHGFKTEKKYIPHVTIAQSVELKIPFNELLDKTKNLFNKEILFDRVTIMKSEQMNGKRIYTPIKVIHLNK